MRKIVSKSFLLLSMIASALPLQNPLVASAASGEIQGSDLKRPSIVTLARTDEDIDDYRISGEEYGSVFALEHGDSIGYRQTFDYLPSDALHEYGYWSWLTSYTLKWKAVAVTRVQGVYATTLLPFADKALLEGGGIVAEENFSWRAAKEVNLLFTEQINWNLKDMANFYLSGSYSSGDFSMQSDVSILTGAKYSFQLLEEHSVDVTLKLDEGAAAYCPEDWFISIGLIGTYYIVDFEYQEFTNWWWGQEPTNGAAPARLRVTIADESAMSFGYIYRRTEHDSGSYNFTDYRYL